MAVSRNFIFFSTTRAAKTKLDTCMQFQDETPAKLNTKT